MATIQFLYRSKKEKSTLTLRLFNRIKQKNTFVECKTNVEVTKLYWDKHHNGKPKEIDIRNKVIEVKAELNLIENHIQQMVNLVTPSNITKEWLRQQMDDFYHPKTNNIKVPHALVDYIDFYIEYRKHELKPTSVKKHKTIKHKLERLQQHRKRVIFINEVDESFKKELESYYKNEQYSQNTLQREFKFIKSYCVHARYLGIETSPQLDKLSFKEEKVEKNYLSFEEIKIIESIEDDKLTDSLKNARDWLIISCFTGQRISDFMKFTQKEITLDDGDFYIDFTQKKTKKEMSIATHPKVLAILEKRNGEFPYPLSDQKYNKYIKKICKIADLNQPTKGKLLQETTVGSKKYRKKEGIYEKWKLVSSHIGRRSFATNHFGIIPISFMMNITGHSTEREFLNYIGKSSKAIAKETFAYFRNQSN